MENSHGVAAGLFKDKEVDVRETAAGVLAERNASVAIPKLVLALDDDAPEVSFAAARSLWSLGDRRGRGVLIAVLAEDQGDSPGLIKGKVREARMRLRDPRGLAMLGVNDGVGMFPATLKDLEEALEDKSWVVRGAAAKALAMRGDKQDAVRLIAAASLVRLETTPAKVSKPPAARPVSPK